MIQMREPLITCDYPTNWNLIEENLSEEEINYKYNVSFTVNAYGIQTDGQAEVIFNKNEHSKSFFNPNGYTISIRLNNFPNLREFDTLGRTQGGNTTFSASVEKYIKIKIREVAEKVALKLEE